MDVVGYMILSMFFNSISTYLDSLPVDRKALRRMPVVLYLTFCRGENEQKTLPNALCQNFELTTDYDEHLLAMQHLIGTSTLERHRDLRRIDVHINSEGICGW